MVWQSKARERFFEIIGLLYWGIQARMEQSLEATRSTCEHRGQAVSANVGLRTKEMRAWRSLGLAITNIHMLVFNLGRVDFRQRHLAAYALEIQSSVTTTHMQDAITCSDAMFTAIGVLVQMRGIIRMMQSLCRGLTLEQQGGRWCITNERKLANPWNATMRKSTLWLTCKTLLMHTCWRVFPKLSSSLTEILLGASFRGVPLQSSTFVEPSGRAASGETHARAAASNREQRFESALCAIDRVLLWAKEERHQFMSRILGVAPCARRGLPVAQGIGNHLPYVPDVALWHLLEDQPLAAAVRAKQKFRCAPARAAMPAVGGASSSSGRHAMPAVGGASSSSSPDDKTLAHVFMDLLGDAFLGDKTLAHDAALELASACELLNTSTTRLSSSDMADVCSGLDAPDIPNESHEPMLTSSSDSEGTMECRPPPRRLASGHRRNWVVFKDTQTGHWTFIPETAHRRRLHAKIHSSVLPRTRFLLLGDQLFGRDLIMTSTPTDDLMPALSAFGDTCAGRFWALPQDQRTPIHNCVRHPPPEIHRRPSPEDLRSQYVRLRSWLHHIQEQPYGHEFFHTTQYTLRGLNRQGSPTGAPFQVSSKALVESGAWGYRYTPRAGTRVSTKQHGPCVLVSSTKVPDMSRFYSFVMATSLAEIRARDIWHIVVAWHYFTHVSTSSESLAESVGSILQYFRRYNINGCLGTKRIVWAAQLKAAGLRGMGGEEAILSMALNHHFKSAGPEGWHFVAARTQRSAIGDYRQHIRREVRLMQRPAWFGTPLLDLIRQGQLVLAKRLPRPALFVVPPDAQRAYEILKPTAKRRLVDTLGDQRFEPAQLAQQLWARLGITVQSLPSCLRPGSSAR